MNPNIEAPLDFEQKMQAIVLTVLISAGVIIFTWLLARTDARIRRIRREFHRRRQEADSRLFVEMCQLHAQEKDTSPIHVPITAREISERRKITKLY